jgi:hypothetical protein
MQPDRSYKPWGAARSLIYFGGLLLTISATGWFIVHPTPEYTTWEKLPAVLIPASWAFATEVLFTLRYAWLKKLIFVTPEGVAVWGEPATREWMTTARQVQVDTVTAEVISWFALYFIRKGHSDARAKLADWFNGTNLEIVVTAEGVGDRRHGIRKKAGLAYPKRLVVQLAPVDMATGASFIATVGHEHGHECCFAFGIPDAEQHKFMSEVGFPYA